MVDKIKVIFLGTSGVIPTEDRNHVAMLLTYRDENILVDCGEGTQRQFRKAKINPGKITKLLITHWHGDHVLGIPGLLQTLAFSGYNKSLEIYGPKGTNKYLKELLNVFHFVNDIKLKIKEVSNGKFFENEHFFLEARPMTHGIPCNAYNFVAKGKIRIDRDKLSKSGLPSGPLIKKLKEGKNVNYKGKKILAKNLTYLQGSKKISFILDTGVNKNIEPFAKYSDLLILESTYADDMKGTAKDYKHLTSSQAGEIAKKAKVKKLILTHISQRYGRDSKVILKGAEDIFKNSVVAKDFDEFEL